ncbi:MAG: SpoIIE family protein phosphatase [Pirellulaceae bacterium]|nr:SpoIIE family protein phosphatase [Pirellulaceae bacterium]
MTDSLTPQLKIHVEETLAEPRIPSDDVPNFPQMQAAFNQATGWNLRFESRQRDDDSMSPAAPGKLIAEMAPQSPPASRDGAESLANSISRLFGELHNARYALRQREAELAAGVPVQPHPEEGLHLAARLESVLKAGAESLGCQAVAAYMLDDATTHLKMRACWGLPRDRFVSPPRPLRGAIADLEALIGHAVVIDDAIMFPHWKCPEEKFGSALCVPISTPSSPLGTLWFYRDAAGSFDDQQTNLAELVAGRIAADLEREILLQQQLATRHVDRELQSAARWQHDRLPIISPLLSNWKVAGARLESDSAGGDFYDWAVLPDGRLALAVGEARAYGFEAALASTSFHATLKAHAAHRHTGKQLLSRINDTLWSSSAGDQHASLFYGLIDPDTGSLEHATAGGGLAVALRGPKMKVLAQEELPLGADPDACFRHRRHRIAPGEWLIVMSESLRGARLLSGGALNERVLAKVAKRRAQVSPDAMAENILLWVRANVDLQYAPDASLLVAKRD